VFNFSHVLIQFQLFRDVARYRAEK